MLTNNGKILMKNVMRAAAIASFGSSLTTDQTTITVKKADGNTIPLKNMSGSYIFPQTRDLSLFYPNMSSPLPFGGLNFGSGSAAPTEEDYTITPLFNYSQSITKMDARSYNDENNNICCDVIYKYVNNHNSQVITINEFGLFSAINNSSNSGAVLVYRDVFEEPIVINPGEIKFIKISVKMGW